MSPPTVNVFAAMNTAAASFYIWSVCEYLMQQPMKGWFYLTQFWLAVTELIAGPAWKVVNASWPELNQLNNNPIGAHKPPQYSHNNYDKIVDNYFTDSYN